jgi:hypothetical protein
VTDASALRHEYLMHAHSLKTIEGWEAKTGDIDGAAVLKDNWHKSMIELTTSNNVVIPTSVSIDNQYRDDLRETIRCFEEVKANGQDAQDALMREISRAINAGDALPQPEEPGSAGR